MAAGPDPYLSVVVATRNDDHGGDALRRTQIFARALLEQCERHRLPTELVIVEWNPPPERPSIAEAVDWPDGGEWSTVRVVEVPPDIHNRLCHSDRLPLYQFIAKNAGIRRASGQFVLATNMDVLFPDTLFAYLARRRLRAGRVYRVDRLDVPATLDDSVPLDEQLAWCAKHVIRVNRREGTLDPRTGEWLTTYRAPRGLTRLRNSQRWRDLRGRVPLHELEVGQSSPALERLSSGLWELRFLLSLAYPAISWAIAGVRQPGPTAGPFLDRAGTVGPSADNGDLASPAGRPTSLMRRLGHEAARMRLHMNGSGDFTLMAKGDWIRTRGYPELELYSMHIDGLQLYRAWCVGLCERFLPFGVYHIDHDGGFRPEAEGDDTLDAVLQQRGIPRIGYAQLMGWFYEMYSTGRPIQFNEDSWGFRDEALPETLVSRPGAPAPPAGRSATPRAGPRD